MECPICFLECKVFKVLQCGHYFCPQCVEAMRQAPSSPGGAPQNPGKLSHSRANLRCDDKDYSDGKKLDKKSEFENKEPTTNGHSESGIGNENSHKVTGGIPCPKCRRSTPLDYCMKNKYVCKLVCRTCDEEKLAEEFRWCQDCRLTTCSRCFVDKHIKTDPETSTIFMHSGSKWNDQNENYPQAVYCAKRLIQELKQADETVKNSQKYIAKYLEDLKEYLSVEIEQKIKSSLEPKEKLLKNLCKSYNVNPAIDISSFDTVKNSDYQTLLDELIKIADIADQSCDLLEESFQFKCLPYKQMSDLLIQSDKKDDNGVKKNKREQKVQKSSKLDLKLCRIVEHPQMKKPNDFCYLPDFNVVLIIDHEAGIFEVDAKTMACRSTSLKLKSQQFCRIRSIPEKLFGVRNVIAFNNQLSDKEWKIAFLDIEKAVGGDDLHFGRKVDQMLTFPDRSKINPTTACSQNGFYCATNKHLYHMKNPKDWGDSVYTCASSDFINLMCPTVPKSHIAETVQLFVSNRTWKSIDILLYNENIRRISASYRISTFNDENCVDDYFLAPLYEIDNVYADQHFTINKESILLANKKNSKLIVWSGLQEGNAEDEYDQKHGNFGAGNFELLFDVFTKFPQKIMRLHKNQATSNPRRLSSNTKTVFTLKLSEDGSGRGTALVAAVASRIKKEKANSTDSEYIALSVGAQ